MLFPIFPPLPPQLEAGAAAAVAVTRCPGRLLREPAGLGLLSCHFLLPGSEDAAQLATGTTGTLPARALVDFLKLFLGAEQPQALGRQETRKGGAGSWDRN